MNKICDNVSRALKELLPLSVINEIACFVFYDDHPRSDYTIDVIICTHNGLVQEYHKRELIDSILIPNITRLYEIKILRNSKCELFYLISAENEIIILSRKNHLKIHKRVLNVENYDIEDRDCRGFASLKIVLKDDAVPLIFDDNFEKLGERIMNMDILKSDESLPVINHLMTKLNEAIYTTNCNKSTLKEYLKLRQIAAFALYQRTQINTKNALFKLNRNAIASVLQIKTQAPIIKYCNKKIVIISSIINENPMPLQDVTILLHGSSKQSIAYTNKIFEKTPISPHWREKHSQIDSHKETTLVTIVNLKEIKDNVLCRIEFDVLLSYTKEGSPYLLQLENVNITALDSMGENFDVLCDKDIDVNIMLLSILATSEKTDLCLRHIKNTDTEAIIVLEIFRKYLKMESLGVNAAIHKTSPYHMLYGVMVVFEDSSVDVMNIQVYSRSHSQVLALIHYMSDSVPCRIVATTQDYKILALTSDLSKYDENHETTGLRLNYEDYAISFTKQTTAIKEYFDNCMIAMSESKDIDVKNKIGFEVDLLAQGVPKFIEFRNNLLDESMSGLKRLSFQRNVPNNKVDIVTIDY